LCVAPANDDSALIGTAAAVLGIGIGIGGCEVVGAGLSVARRPGQLQRVGVEARACGLAAHLVAGSALACTV